MKNTFAKPGDSVLKTRAVAVLASEVGSAEIKAIIDRMIDIAHGEQKDATKPIMVGLAAPQIGISKRIILVDVGADGRGKVSDLRVYINPEIVLASQGTEEWYEGCYSVQRDIKGIVARPSRVKIRALSFDGKVVHEVHTGYVARIFQHETDHLNGIIFTRYISKIEDCHIVGDDEMVSYRNNEAWRAWPKKCSEARWRTIQSK